jgi:hypothetical protein
MQSPYLRKDGIGLGKLHSFVKIVVYHPDRASPKVYVNNSFYLLSFLKYLWSIADKVQFMVGANKP